MKYNVNVRKYVKMRQDILPKVSTLTQVFEVRWCILSCFCINKESWHTLNSKWLPDKTPIQ